MHFECIYSVAAAYADYVHGAQRTFPTRWWLWTFGAYLEQIRKR